MAQGKYITFVDADDYLEPDALQYMVSTIENVKTDVAGFGFCENDEKDNRIPFRRFYTGKDKDLIIRNIISNEDNRLNGLFMCMVWAKIYKREFLIHNKMYFLQDIAPNEDLFYNISILQKTERYYVDNKIVYHYIYYSDSAIHKFTNRHISVAINIMPKLEKYVACYYPDNNVFYDAIVRRAYYYVRVNTEIYFTHTKNTKTFWELKSEMDYFLGHPNISKWLKKLKLSDAEDMIDFKNRLLLKLHIYWIFLITERRKRRKSFM